MQNGTAQGQTNPNIGLTKVNPNVLHFILFMWLKWLRLVKAFFMEDDDPYICYIVHTVAANDLITQWYWPNPIGKFQVTHAKANTLIPKFMGHT